MKKLIFLFLVYLLLPISISAQNGCCSWHDGISHCSVNGYYVCNDGTESPTCTCSANDITFKLTDTSNITLFDENELNNLREENRSLKEDSKKLKAENNKLKSNVQKLRYTLIIGIIVLSIYLIFIRFNKEKQ